MRTEQEVLVDSIMLLESTSPALKRFATPVNPHTWTQLYDETDTELGFSTSVPASGDLDDLVTSSDEWDAENCGREARRLASRLAEVESSLRYDIESDEDGLLIVGVYPANLSAQEAAQVAMRLSDVFVAERDRRYRSRISFDVRIE